MIDPKIHEELIDLEAEVKDAQHDLDNNQFDFDSAKKHVEESKVTLAEWIIKLDKFKKEHNLK
jgi:hypothetical protein